MARIRQWGVKMPAGLDPAIDALFAAVGRWARAPRFEGAGFTRVAMELADLPGHPARAVARRHKADVEAWLAGELARRGARSPEQSARELQLLLEGAMALILIHGDPSYAAAAAEAAKRLLRRHEAQTGRDHPSRLGANAPRTSG
jgi:hypothetical protein